MNLLKLIGEFNEKKANSRHEETVLRRVNSLLSDETDFIVNEAYKTARTNVMFALSSEKGCKKIIVTSASPGEGKTTTCLNLAIAFAQTESKVLVIDGDLRKPRIYRHLGLSREDGLSDVLCGMITLEKAIKHCEKQNLDCITSGQIPPNPAELLSSKEMEQLLAELAQRYDYIFIDTPPVTLVTEAAAMAKFVSGVIVVVRQNYTIQESIQRARTNLEFANAKILGYILNGIESSHYGYGGYRRYGYGRYRRYGYGYGYNSYRHNTNGYSDTRYGYGYGYKKTKREEEKDKQEKFTFIEKIKRIARNEKQDPTKPGETEKKK